MKELPSLEWFGSAWDAELCETRPRVQTPVGEPCEGCGGILTYSAQGIVAPEPDERGVRLTLWHLRCFRRSSVWGSGQV